jgi:hypothetical protein
MSTALIKRLGEALAETGGEQGLADVILYAPFGIVRGELSGTRLRAAAEDLKADPHENIILELQRVTVEHYSNHLPTGNYDRLAVSLRDISGFVFIAP